MDIRVRKHAELMLKYSLDLKKGERLLIMGTEAAIEFMKEAYKIAIDMGAKPYIRVEFEDLMEYKMKHGNDEQIEYIPEPDMEAFKTVDAALYLWGETNTRMFNNIDPAVMKKRSISRKKWFDIFYGRVDKGELRWAGTLSPTNANAQEAGMSLSEYEEFVYDACGINDDDPVKKWMEFKEEQDRICSILDTKKTLRIVSKDTDISMSVEGRKWVNCCGHVNMPDGEVFTSPVEDSVNGYIRYSFPGIYLNREVEDITLKFENGKVVEARAAKGEDYLNELLSMDEGARILGEVAVGTNFGIKKFTKNILFDEKLGGTVHLAVGRGFGESGSKNTSGLHWDMICDMKDGGKIYADGELIYENGRFII